MQYNINIQTNCFRQKTVLKKKLENTTIWNYLYKYQFIDG